MKRLIGIWIFFIVSIQLFSLGAFNTFNQRNHAELKWKEIESTHIRIIYHEPLQDYAVASAKVAEGAWQHLSSKYKVTPKDKIDLYISDQDDITNGATVLNSYIFIWVNQNDYIRVFTGKEKWLEKVIPHEMSHYFLSYSITDWLSKYMPISKLTFPREVNEGFAQYFSCEPWGYNRGDRYLRTAVFANQMDYSGAYHDNGGLIYAKGFSMVSYLSSQYGEDKLIAMLNYRTKSKEYKFDKAFESVYHKKFDEFIEEWKRYIYTWYYGNVYELKNTVALDSTASYTLNGLDLLKTGYYSISNITANHNKVIASIRRNQYQKYSELITADLNIDSLKANKMVLQNTKTFAIGGYFLHNAQSNNLQYITYSSYTRQEKGKIGTEVFLINTTTGENQSISAGNYSVVNNEGAVWYQHISTKDNAIYKYANNKKTKVLAFDNNTQIYDLQLSQDEKKLAVLLFDEKKRFVLNIYDLDSMNILYTKEQENAVQKMIYANDNAIFLSSEKGPDYRLVIEQYNLTTGQVISYLAPAYNIEPIQLEPKNNELEVIGFVDYNRNNVSLCKIKLQAETMPAQTTIKSQTEQYYGKWISQTQGKEIAFPDTCTISVPTDYNSIKNIKPRTFIIFPSGEGLMLSTILSEAMGKHLFSFVASVPYSDFPKHLYYFANYNNTCIAPTITVNSYRSGLFAGVWENKPYFMLDKSISITASLPLDWIRKPFWGLECYSGLSYHDFDMKDRSFNVQPYYEEGSTASYQAGFTVGYNLSYANNQVHPVRKFQLQYSVEGSSNKLGMNKSFTSHHAFLENTYSPFLNLTSNEFTRTIAFTQKTSWDLLNGRYFIQYQPGIDRYEKYMNGNAPFFNRFYVRGYKETALAKQFVQMQQEVWFKLTNNVNANIDALLPILTADYVGLGFWVDYNRLISIKEPYSLRGKDKELKALGSELKINSDIMSFNVVHRLGYAADYKMKDWSFYYLLSLNTPGL